MFGPGKIADLFPKQDGAAAPAAGEAEQEAAAAAVQQGEHDMEQDKPPTPAPVEEGHNIVSFAQQLMNANTTQLDAKEQAGKSREVEGDEKEQGEEEQKNGEGRRVKKGEVKAQLKSLFSRISGKSSS